MKLEEKEQVYKAVTLYEGEEEIGRGNIEIVGREVWLCYFAIREDFRGKGYGQKALQIFIETYGVNTLTCAIKNEIAFHIYKKYGFEVVEVCDTFADGRVYLMKRKEWRCKVERLTKRFENGRAYVFVRDIMKRGHEAQAEANIKAVNRLAELEDKLESGQLVELPIILKWFADPKLCQVLFVEDKHICLTETMTEAQAEARIKALKEKG